MQFKEVDLSDLPQCDVLAYSYSGHKLIGKLKNMSDIVVCVTHDTSLSNISHYLPLDEIKPSDSVLLPRKLTAENGAKALLSGGFMQVVEVNNPDYCGCGNLRCGICEANPNEPETITEEAYISWDNIKAIYSKIVSHFAS